MTDSRSSERDHEHWFAHQERYYGKKRTDSSGNFDVYIYSGAGKLQGLMSFDTEAEALRSIFELGGTYPPDTVWKVVKRETRSDVPRSYVPP
jgi:hypothetical protein